MKLASVSSEQAENLFSEILLGDAQQNQYSLVSQQVLHEVERAPSM